jgi:hypothetical protein
MLLATLPAAASITVLDTQGFEAPLFSTTFDPLTAGSYAGQLEGQPISPPEETWQQSGPNASTATVQSAIVQSGLQAVRVDYGGADTRWGVPLSGLPFTPTDLITISWDMRVEGPAGDPMSDFGPFFGVEAYANPLGGNTLLGSFGVDATTGELLYQETTTGFFVAPGPTVFFGEWNAFKIVLDYAVQAYNVFLNNALVVGGIGFVDGSFATFSDADISALSAGTPGLEGTAYFDNFLITADVPELPAGATWLGLALAASGGYWWKQRRAVGAVA